MKTPKVPKVPGVKRTPGTGGSKRGRKPGSRGGGAAGSGLTREDAEGQYQDEGGVQAPGETSADADVALCVCLFFPNALVSFHKLHRSTGCP